MPRHKIVAAFNDYAGMIDAMRARAADRRIAITSPHVAEMAGLPDYYIAKLLSVHPVRRIGMISLGPLLGVLGVKLLMIEDREAMARFTGKLSKRNEACVHNGAAVTFTFSRRYMQKIGQKGQQVWQQNRRKAMRLAKKRSASSRHAALARWSVTDVVNRALVDAGSSKASTASPPASAPQRGRRRSAGSGAAKGRAPRR